MTGLQSLVQKARRRKSLLLAGLFFTVGGIFTVSWLIRYLTAQASSRQGQIAWGTGNPATREALVTRQNSVACPGAPFILPADGYIGLLYDDPNGPYSDTHRHQGIDIFSPGDPGVTPVYAAYDGYLTRESSWKSSLIIRVPDDPLVPGRQIWLYYTHMADRAGSVDYIDDAFPPGTHEVFVQQGTFLGYTGNYNGGALRSIWVHLHFSIVRDDGSGHYTNELDIANTIDPSPYLGMAVRYGCAPRVPVCTSDPLCEESTPTG